MATQSNSKQSNKNSNNQTHKHHFIRTPIASLFGLIALVLVLASILVVWLNRTLTDTKTFVKTVTPVIAQRDVQNFISDKITDSLLEKAPAEDLAQKLLSPVEVAGKTTDQLKTALKPVISSSVQQVVSSPEFNKVLSSNLQTAHASMIQQLNSDGNPEINLDLDPVITSVLSELKKTKLSFVSEKLEIKPGAGKLNLKGGSVEKAHDKYKLFQQGTLALVAVTVTAAILCVLISAHHLRTLRRVILGTGIIAGLVALSLQAPSLIKTDGADVLQKKAGVAIATVLFHDLQLACIIIATVCIVGAIASKIYSKITSK